MSLLHQLKKDNFVLGAILGLVLPALAYLVVLGVDLAIRRISGAEEVLEQSTM
ncbi:MAG: hypothetical protein IH599_00550, partial [Bacteroidales bacterium]|nr:hypothetical protein [Bacteroidales bacterium]